MFHVTIQHGKQQTVSELYMDRIVLRANKSIQTKNMNSDILI